VGNVLAIEALAVGIIDKRQEDRRVIWLVASSFSQGIFVGRYGVVCTMTRNFARRSTAEIYVKI